MREEKSEKRERTRDQTRVVVVGRQTVHCVRGPISPRTWSALSLPIRWAGKVIARFKLPSLVASGASALSKHTLKVSLLTGLGLFFAHTKREGI